jgi:hypothetical protein
MGISRRRSAAFWVLALAAACAGCAANTDAGLVPVLDAAIDDALAGGGPDAGMLDAGSPDGSDAREPDAGGSFEGAAAWTFSGSAQRSTGGFPHTGTAYGALGLANSASGGAAQAVTIPGDARSADLTF